MRKHWLLFTQTVTVALAILFVIHTLKPELLPNFARTGVVTLYESAMQPDGSSSAPTSGLSRAANKAMPAVVNVFTSTVVKTPANPFMDDPRFRFFFGDLGETEPQSNSSLGSGVIVSPDGFILTNHHVVEAADQIEVALADGRKARAHVIGSDPETDLAVIKIDLAGNLPAITFGHPELSHVGDMVLAIGNPFGVGQTVTMGIISALKRDHLGLNTFESFIQTDAAINPGNSGGALVDVNGNLIGINSAIYSPNGGSLGIGFAIPATTAKKTMEQIIKKGSVTRGWLGAGVQELTPELRESFKLNDTQGVLITEVIRNSPAELAGVQPGDILLTIDGQPINDWNAMLNTVTNLPPGKVATLKLMRNGSEQLFQAKIGTRPKPKEQ
ncbi:MAG: 2-alkenal reductase [Gallionellaceae bacterium CG1_02_56_997]|nr:Do family serine endopeptidase [Gallionella sp.]OIO73484.1 MAG: 2-alkenal reductase [Gallionellaceae bacterium CG1_02_56_997]PIV15553.1 MAG: 2-alkenal reductase [Gallionellales bacterium CG03_land_8_20_14_0_80_55_15]PIV91837.1 MAG: 2-alkenal reductase [Gallionellales bacterium CG17_big_fil_post_rev_8_21_14_2_50_54_146]PIX05530.1 MAG: 2-alkenal reductase [Gallionellales bacterium CG_4_8_14_3_um_filter_54_18]PJC03698.1 MAG: 2-alkenal reductase [Gallionellales bacterium CG_4_9_14_0_8_um_filter